MQLYWLNTFKKGNIAMMPKPKGGDALLKEIQTLKKLKIDCVVCLIEQSEMQELDLLKEANICNMNQIDFIHFPIKDFNLPEKEAYLELLNKIDKRLKLNQNIAIHCRAGIGRTGTVTAGILLKNKLHTTSVFDFLSKKRTCNVPDTKAQKDWVLSLEF